MVRFVCVLFSDLKHRPFMNLSDIRGEVYPNAYIAPSAAVVGDVLVRDHSCVWYGAVVRGTLKRCCGDDGFLVHGIRLAFDPGLQPCSFAG